MSGHEKQISKATNCRSITWPERHVTWAGPGGGGGGGGGGGVGGRGRQRRIGAGIDKQIVVVDVVVVVDVGASFIVAPVSFFFFLFFLFRFPGASSSTSRQVRGGGSSEAKKKMLKKNGKQKNEGGVAREPRHRSITPESKLTWFVHHDRFVATEWLFIQLDFISIPLQQMVVASTVFFHLILTWIHLIYRVLLGF